MRAAQPRRLRRGGPVLGLTSGYIQRSAHLLPKQGSAHPWKVHQSYLRDYRALKMSDIEDSVMEFSGPGVPAELRRRGLVSPRRDGGVDVKDFSGRVAAITGAGRASAGPSPTELARRGAPLALSDIDDVGLAATVAARARATASR